MALYILVLIIFFSVFREIIKNFVSIYDLAVKFLVQASLARLAITLSVFRRWQRDVLTLYCCPIIALASATINAYLIRADDTQVPYDNTVDKTPCYDHVL